MNDDFSLYFWGVRGSHVSSGPEFVQTGGNTSCVEVQVANQHVICDAGTGLIGLGERLIEAPPRPLLIVLSHYHHDHLQGLPHFAPLYRPGQQVFLVAPWDAHHERVWEQLLQAGPRSPLLARPSLRARRHTLLIEGGERLWWNADAPDPLQLVPPEADAPPAGWVEITTFRSLGHPRNGSMCYRIAHGDRSIVFATDTESFMGVEQELTQFARGTDLIIHDAHYTPAEYADPTNSKQGWGHSTWEMAVALAAQAAIPRLALFHHDPAHDDALMATLEAAAQARFPGAFVAREGCTVKINPPEAALKPAALIETTEQEPVPAGEAA